MEALSFWNERWTDKKTGWHKNEPNQLLVKHSPRMELMPHKRVLLPLCGKSLDLLWLYEKGLQVVGIEGIEEPVKEFFDEHELTFSVKELSWAKVYQTSDEKLKIYVCSIYDVVPSEMGKFDALWDRGSLVAIYPEDRERYVALMKQMLAPSCKYLLSTMEYDGVDTKSGPPRCIPPELTEKLYGDLCKIEQLDKIDISDERTRTEWGLSEVWEVISLLTPK